MLYYLFKYTYEIMNWPGTGVFKYISFRAAAAALFSVCITIVLGRKLIEFFHNYQVKDAVRDLALDDQDAKSDTPTMGGLVIIAAIVIPTLLFARLSNPYILLLLTATLWMGTVGLLMITSRYSRKTKRA